jgi:hypothetical protein
MSHFPKTAPLAATVLAAHAQTLTMTVRGSFHVQHEAEAHDRCGPKGATRQLDWTVSVTSAPAMLDDEGFLLDWQVVRNYFPKTFARVGHFPSCEQIAVRAVHDIAALCPGRVSEVTATVGFHGGPADMEAKWTAPAGWWQALAEAEKYGTAPVMQEA